MADISSLEEDIKGYRDQLESIESLLALDPQNDEYIALKKDITDAIQLTEDAINDLRPASAPPPPERDTSPTEKPKWSIENHPAYQAGYRKSSEKATESVVYKVGDQVLAKWVSGDNGFYPARITSITGSSSNPIYYVEFRKYKNTEALKYADLKPVYHNIGADSKKRKADGSPVPTIGGGSTSSTSMPSPSTSSPTSVISAAASINPAFKKAAVEEEKKEPSKVSDGPIRPAKIPKKIRGQKEYEAGKSKWQAFSTKGGKVAKTGKKESMFRTSDSVTSRVGFTGSGQAMRKDPSRSRHVYQAIEDDDGDAE